MEKQSQSTSEMDRLADLVKDARIGMLTTEESDGSLRSRPLATLQMDSDGQLWFFTSISSAKVDEISQHRQVNVSYSNVREQDYVSISGTAEVVQDRQKMRDLWTAWVEPWFPKGVEDPDLGLLKVTVEYAEYWDSPGNKAVRLAGLARAMATGNKSALGENRKVTPPRH